jgi:uncharacterized protein YndB with AHSA1/START domain
MVETCAIHITRTFDASLEKMWQAWTDPETVMRWWGPKTFTAPSCVIDLRIGGKYLFCMRGQPGPDMPEQDFWITGEYLDIIPMQKIVMTDNFSDKDGNIVSATAYGMGTDWPEYSTFTIEFKDVGDGTTTMNMTHEGVLAGEISEKTRESWNESFDKIAAMFP